MKANFLSSCSINEVADIGYGRLDGKGLLIEFLTTIRLLAKSFDAKTKRTILQFNSHGAPTYVWSGVVKGPANGSSLAIGPTYPFSGYTLAEYINTQDIGKVGMSEAAPNAYHGNDRLTQAFVWAPNMKKLGAWVNNENVLEENKKEAGKGGAK